VQQEQTTPAATTLQHALTRNEARRGILFPLALCLFWGFCLLSSPNRWSMTLVSGALLALYTAQFVGAIRNYLRVCRGETVLVLAPPPSPILFLWAFGAIISTTAAIIGAVGAFVTIFMALTSAAAWYVPLVFFLVGAVFTFIARVSWRRLRAIQATIAFSQPEASTPAPVTENPGRWWTRNDAR
jgi:hypothetical protein